MLKELLGLENKGVVVAVVDLHVVCDRFEVLNRKVDEANNVAAKQERRIAQLEGENSELREQLARHEYFNRSK